MTQKTFIWTLIFCALINACGQPNEDKENDKNKITITYHNVTNESRFVLFIDNLNKNITDKFEIYSYTVEGDSIIKEVEFNGKTIIITTDNTRDKYTDADDRQIRKREVPIDSINKLNTLKEFINKY